MIGVFDSGVGGLSVLRELRLAVPGARILYLADQANVPYGPRPLDEIRRLSREITRFLLGQGAGLVVVACNTASSAALRELREEFGPVPFVGMEPAVKPAAERGCGRTIGVIATRGTLEGPLFGSVVDRFARDVRVITQPCPGLVERIEAGEVGGHGLRALLERLLGPLLAEGIDCLVLGCTHYPLALEAIREVLGPTVAVIDPSPAVARQARRLLEERGWASPAPPPAPVRFFTTGDPPAFRATVERLTGERSPAVEGLRWADGRLVPAGG